MYLIKEDTIIAYMLQVFCAIYVVYVPFMICYIYIHLLTSIVKQMRLNYYFCMEAFISTPMLAYVPIHLISCYNVLLCANCGLLYSALLPYMYVIFRVTVVSM